MSKVFDINKIYASMDESCDDRAIKTLRSIKRPPKLPAKTAPAGKRKGK